jgi:predicted dienelactone hydrolase
MQTSIAGSTADAPTTTVALYYPTMSAPRVIAMGPFALDVAIGAKPVDQVKALILLSHGIGGSELGHSQLAQALARNGYLVAALRHPGDNWQDRSLIEKSAERYFDERPRQASRVIDAILAIACGRTGSRPTAADRASGLSATRPAATRCSRWQELGRTCPG